MRKIQTGICSLMIAAYCAGCVPLVAGVAGGAGTAVWLSGKLVQEIDIPKEKTLAAVEKGLAEMKLKVTKKTVTDEIIQVMGKYFDGKTIWIDIRPMGNSDERSQLAVRVGTLGDKEAARQLMDTILKNL